MARIRTVKPEFWLDEDLASLPPESRLMALGLLNHADDQGYFKANPALIKAAIFPFNECSLSIQAMLGQLQKIGYILLCTGSDSKPYGLVKNFLKHQRVNRPYPSTIKPLCDFTNHSVNAHEQFTEHSPLEKERNRKGNGMEKEKEDRANALDVNALFDEFWQSWPTGYGEKGSRKNAEREFLKIRPDRDLLTKMVVAADAQFRDKQAKAQSGQFYSAFKHVERWLKNREWENEIDYQRPAKPSSEQRLESVLDEALGPRQPAPDFIEGNFQRVGSYELDDKSLG